MPRRSQITLQPHRGSSPPQTFCFSNCAPPGLHSGKLMIWNLPTAESFILSLLCTLGLSPRLYIPAVKHSPDRPPPSVHLVIDHLLGVAFGQSFKAKIPETSNDIRRSSPVQDCTATSMFSQRNTPISLLLCIQATPFLLTKSHDATEPRRQQSAVFRKQDAFQLIIKHLK